MLDTRGYDENSGAASLGTAMHSYMAEYIVNGSVSSSSLEMIAAINGVRVNNMWQLIATGEEMWGSLKEIITEPVVERELTRDFKKFILTGHPDVYGNDAVGDWKSGDKGPWAAAQVGGYGLLTDAKTGYLAYIRFGHTTYNPEEIDLSDAHRLIPAIEAQISLIGKKFVTGSHCKYCKNKPKCRAYRQWVKDTLAFVTSKSPESAECFGDAYIKVSMLSGKCKKAMELVKQQVKAVGSVSLGEHAELRIKASTNREIDPGQAWEPLQERFGDDMSQIVKIQKGKMEKLIMAQSDAGEKGAAVRAFMDKLRKADAIIETPGSERLSIESVVGDET